MSCVCQARQVTNGHILFGSETQTLFVGAGTPGNEGCPSYFGNCRRAGRRWCFSTIPAQSRWPFSTINTSISAGSLWLNASDDTISFVTTTTNLSISSTTHLNERNRMTYTKYLHKELKIFPLSFLQWSYMHTQIHTSIHPTIMFVLVLFFLFVITVITKLILKHVVIILTGEKVCKDHRITIVGWGC